MAKGKSPILIGVEDGIKEYYLVPATPPDAEKQVAEHIAWRVPDIREAVRADEGYKIVSADFSQIEIRIMAFLSQDKWLMDALNSGKDVHCFMACDAYGIDYDTFYKAIKDPTDPMYFTYTKMRSDIKTTTFGVPYGAAAPRIAMMTGKTIEEAQKLIDRYFAKAVGLKRWLDTQAQIATMYGYSKSIKGRMRFYLIPDKTDPDFERKLDQIRRWSGNQPIQASCSDLLKMSLYEIYCGLRGGNEIGPKIYDACIAFCVHDEIVIAASVGCVDAVSKIMTEAMDGCYNKIITGIGHKTDVSVADYWKKA